MNYFVRMSVCLSVSHTLKKIVLKTARLDFYINFNGGKAVEIGYFEMYIYMRMKKIT